MIVPVALRKQVLKELHVGHPGIVRMKTLARSIVYWPGLDIECENLVKNCTSCLESAKSPIKVPLKAWDVPQRVWERVHIDFAGPVNGVFYLVIVDALSKWPEVIPLTTITTGNTIRALSGVFSRYGNPETLVSDNGTQFTSEDFKVMCESRGINHLRIAPYHPQSNGQAERFVDTLKRGFKKLNGEGPPTLATLDELLMSYRTTPSAILCNKSPSEIFLGRKLRTPLSLISPNKRPKCTENFDSREAMRTRTEDQFNRRNGTQPREYERGDSVLVHKHSGLNWKWTPAVVKSKLGDVLYEVELDGKLPKDMPTK